MKKEVTKVALSLAALAVGTEAAMAQDWAGTYAGLSLTKNTGTSPWNAGDGYSDYKLDDTGLAGAFVGHRWNVGKSVVGIELDVSQGGLNADANDLGDTDYSMSSFVDTKISVGVPMGKALIYGFTGITASNVNADYSGDNDWSADYGVWGTNLGLGVDYMVTDKMSLGAEVMRRGWEQGYGESANEATTAVSLRASFHF